MPLPTAYKLFIDPRNNLAFGNFSGSSQITRPIFTLGDTAGLEIYLIESTQFNTYPRQELEFPVSPGIKVAVGSIDESPLSGTWRMQYGSDITTALAHNITAPALQTALNLLPSITAAGGVVISKIGDNYNITFSVNGVRTELLTDSSSLVPLSAATASILQIGTSSQPSITMVHLQRSVAGLATVFNQTSPSTITVSTLAAWDSLKASFRVSISPEPKGGSFTLNFDALTGIDVSTSSFSIGASALDVQNGLNIGALEGKVSVTQVGAYAYDITVSQQPGSLGLTANGSGILSFNGFVGEISLNTAEALSLLDGADSIETFLEVEITADSKTLTILQVPCILKNSVIDVGSVVPLVLDSYLSQTTADGRYARQSNNLSDLANLGTARTNLSVYSTGQMDTAIALKADVSHSHIVSDVTGLQTALDDKASTSHSQAISTVTDLQAALDAKYDASNPSGYIDASALPSLAGYATESWVDMNFYPATSNPSGFLADAPSDGNQYARKDGAWDVASIPSLTGYALESWVSNNYYSISNPAGYVDSGIINGLLSSEVAANTYYPLNNPENYIYLNSYGALNLPNTSNPTLTAGQFYYNSFKLRYTDGTAIMTVASENWVNLQGFITSSALTPYALLAGATFTGKVNLGSIGVGNPSINLGNQCDSSPANAVNGDLWISNAASPKLTYRMGNVNYNLPVLNLFNTFTNAQVIDTSNTIPALRVTQRGTGDALLVEDATTPDTSAFVVNATGEVGIGVATGFTSSNKLKVVGTVEATDITFNGTQKFKINSIQSHTGGADTHELLVSFNGSTYRMGMKFVSTP